jgi:RHS repeat-associated protein
LNRLTAVKDPFMSLVALARANPHDYNYFRDYDPSIGRYIQSDPIGLVAGTATYGYVSSQPLAYVDPRGPDFPRFPGHFS